ncbi:hypothetical protein [Microbacterium sp. RU33B]|uniref:hypothetical protein n=1 Tax=Microbacterium sp. RU33B TaxID=1907390 RepID=UPI000965D22D|nr:hypothetical protein [Microbacterium sp. RU33B]SIT87698.1 hypothetical protein SAMN05880545_2841 [Microbacterium sp. RU33B]
MPEYTENDFDDSFNTRVRESMNTTTTTNNSTLAVDLDDVGNTDASVNDSGNVTAGLDNVGNVDSHDSSTGIDGSYNDWSDNSVDDHSDNSTNDSGNDNSSSWIEGSYNSHLDESVDDHSIDVGAREYNTGFGNLTLGGGGGGGGDVWVNNQNTIVDQSFNANVDGWGGYEGGSSAVVASGNGAMAAGGDLNLSQVTDRSTNFTAQGDVNVGNETRTTNIVDSYNEETDASSWTDSSTHLDVSDSYNDESASYTAENSFNDELTSQSESTWDIDADVIWGSEDVAIVDAPMTDMAFDGS